MTHRKRDRFNIYRDGKLNVCARMCKTCIYRPDTEIPEARKRLSKQASAEDKVIICHSTLGTEANAVCRGFYQNEPSVTLKNAAAMGVIEFQDVK